MRLKDLSLLLLLLFSSPLLSQTQHYKGTWTKINTTYQFDFELTLNVNNSNQVEGVFLWRVIQYDENNILSKNHYKEKINMTAREYVRGTYFPSKREYVLKGYKKEDPNNIIGMDIYHMKVDESDDLGGTTNSNGSWLGRINGTPLYLEVL